MAIGGIATTFTRMMGIRYPIVGAPMFLVSSPRLVAAVSNAGGLGSIPTLNYKTGEALKEGLAEIGRLTDRPYAVNIIVNKANRRRDEDAKICLDAGVPVFITSLGSPRDLIAKAHANGCKVFCDVVDLPYAKKVEDLGADGVVAVGAGAGGHAGRIVPQVLVPHLKENLTIPVLAAGGIADGRGMLSALALGADGVYMGTRFIASTEAEVAGAYKDAVLRCAPEDVVYTARLTGTHANFIGTPYIKKLGTELTWLERVLYTHRWTKKWAKGFRVWSVSRHMRSSAQKDGEARVWKDIWSAGQTAALVHEVLPASVIIERIVAEYGRALSSLPHAECPPE
jgi:nitronate monooxygenase